MFSKNIKNKIKNFTKCKDIIIPLLQKNRAIQT